MVRRIITGLDTLLTGSGAPEHALCSPSLRPECDRAACLRRGDRIDYQAEPDPQGKKICPVLRVGFQPTPRIRVKESKSPPSLYWRRGVDAKQVIEMPHAAWTCFLEVDESV
ncbi:hypothetical protein PV325_010325 [Microctonus aethiopoides]|nr:hypothetical protein PV325_010325 [Microctonus aethiopoides]KAK0094560.1 hypothetical protein PV326_010590 [Microctonus aethiopoides]